MAFTNSWDETTPTGSDAASVADDFFRKHRLDLGERLEVMFYGFNASDNSSPEDVPGVKSLPFRNQGDTPSTPSTDYGLVYVKNVDGIPELFYLDDEGNEIQLTSAGSLGSLSTSLLARTIVVNSATGNTPASFQSEDVNANIELYDNGTTGGKESALKRTSDVLTLSPDGGDNRLGTATASATANNRQIADKGYVDDSALNPGIAKAWVVFSGAGNMLANHNVTGVNRTDTGKFTITWDTNFSSAEYAIAGFCAKGAGVTAGVVCNSSEDTPLAAGSAKIETRETADNDLQNFTRTTVIAFGDQ